MALRACPDCGSHDLELRELLVDTRRHLVCLECGHDWLQGEPRVSRPSLDSLVGARGRFPTADGVSQSAQDRVLSLKEQFLRERPAPAQDVAPYWVKYQEVFSADGLADCEPQLLKDFANVPTGGRPGIMSVFNSAWNDLGSSEASRQLRATIGYLLRGPEGVAEEDRLTELIRGDRGLGMTGFRESLLTKVLCVVQPERFIPILMYTGSAGKREIADSVFGLKLPAPQSTSWTPGRLTYWSNDLLRELVGGGFVDNVHVAEYLWWAKDQKALAASIA